jgi:hypothetical protein
MRRASTQQTEDDQRGTGRRGRDDEDRGGKQLEGKEEVEWEGGKGMGMQGVQEVAGEDCEYRRAPEGCAQGAGVGQEEL